MKVPEIYMPIVNDVKEVYTTHFPEICRVQYFYVDLEAHKESTINMYFYINLRKITLEDIEKYISYIDINGFDIKCQIPTAFMIDANSSYEWSEDSAYDKELECFAIYLKPLKYIHLNQKNPPSEKPQDSE